MFAIPPAVLVAFTCIVGASALVGVLIKVFGPPVVALLNAHITAKTASLIRTIVDDVYLVGSAVASITPTSLDDDVLKLVKQVDDQFQALHGRPLTDGEKTLAKTAILAKHVDPDQPNLSPPKA